MTDTPMHLFLTGGTGFMGRALLRHWLAEKSASSPVATPVTTPESVTVLTRNPEGFLAHYPEFAGLPWLRFHWGDVQIPATLPAAPTSGGKATNPPSAAPFSHILHAAAPNPARGAPLSPLQHYSQIVSGTRNLLEWAAAHNSQHGGSLRLLYISSGAAYGNAPHDMERMAENHHGLPDPLNPLNAYGVGKRCAEHLCALYAQQYGIELVVARCFAFVGRDLPLDTHFAIGNFIRDALTGMQITLTGDGTPLRSYMDQRDMARWLAVLLQRGQPGHAYNVGADSAISIADLATQVRNLLTPGKPIQVLAQNTRDAGSLLRRRYIPDTSKARAELGLQLHYPLADAIRETARHVPNALFR